MRQSPAHKSWENIACKERKTKQMTHATDRNRQKPKEAEEKHESKGGGTCTMNMVSFTVHTADQEKGARIRMTPCCRGSEGRIHYVTAPVSLLHARTHTHTAYRQITCNADYVTQSTDPKHLRRHVGRKPSCSKSIMCIGVP